MDDPNSAHYLQTVVELGEKRPVTTSRAIYNTQGLKVLDKGVAINAQLYARLQQHQFDAPLDDTVSSSTTVTGRQLREAATALGAQLPFFARLMAEPGLRDLLLDGLEAVPLPPAVAFQLTLACEVRPTLFEHLVRSALLAAWLGYTPLAPRFDVTMLCAAGLLHDLGMLRIDPVLLAPRQQLTAEQRRQLYSHPLLSAMLLERHHDYPRTLLRAVLEHQEYLDGSGYPRALAGDAVSPWGRLLSLAQMASAMFGSGGEAPELRLSVVLRMNPHRYDAGLVQRLTGLLDPRWPADASSPERLPRPAEVLADIDRLLADWPTAVLQARGITPERQARLGLVAVQCAQLRRTLADSGAAPQQLALLAGQPEDGQLQLELSLMAREAAWQLRTLARTTRRRWQAEADDMPGSSYAGWLRASEAVFQPLLHTPAAEDDASGEG
ncbi:HD domain-containing phosphohydrolase [Aquincola sp. MAHUQ-54]|uniref:HD domain-containing phosphohydrolase n=1 Tax=Aquincola agrisoli TaxID=3119538 RepID=A0AAW9QK68_9BURK